MTQMMHTKRLIGAAGILGLAHLFGGCAPPVPGVTREAAMTQMPDLACIRKDLLAMPDTVMISENNGRDEDNIFGFKVPPLYQFRYRRAAWTGDDSIVLRIEESLAGRYGISQTETATDRHAVEAHAAMTRQYMQQVEAKLGADCGLSFDPAS